MTHANLYPSRQVLDYLRMRGDINLGNNKLKTTIMPSYPPIYYYKCHNCGWTKKVKYKIEEITLSE